MHRRTPVLLIAGLLLAFLTAGCLGGDDDPAPAEQDDGSQEMDGSGSAAADSDETGDESDPAQGDGVDEEDACVIEIDPVASWSFDGPAVPDPAGWDPDNDPPEALVAQRGELTFPVDEAEALHIQAGIGDHVTLGWSVTLLDPLGAEPYSWSGGPGAAVDDPQADSATVTGPAAGSWALAWSVTGHIEGLVVSVAAQVCR